MEWGGVGCRQGPTGVPSLVKTQQSSLPTSMSVVCVVLSTGVSTRLSSVLDGCHVWGTGVGPFRGRLCYVLCLHVSKVCPYTCPNVYAVYGSVLRCPYIRFVCGFARMCVRECV